MGGQPIGLDTKLIVTIDNSTNEGTIDNYLNNTEKQNYKWDMGETIVYPTGDISNKQIDVKLAEPKSNSLILLVTLSG